MAEILFDGVTKVFDEGTVAVNDLNLKVQDGSLMILVGPSGCGKTTALRCVAGLADITAGDVGVTTIYVTHDQVEAMTMGDRVAVLKTGVLQQVDEPSQLYRRPANLFVAGFIGSPAMNFVEAKVASENGSVFVEFAGQRLDV